MTDEQLKNKKKFYEDKKVEIAEADYSDKVKAEVDAFRVEKEQEIAVFEAETSKKYEDNRKEELKACNHYIEIIDILIADEESAKEIVSSDETANDVVENADI